MKSDDASPAGRSRGAPGGSGWALPMLLALATVVAAVAMWSRQLDDSTPRDSPEASVGATKWTPSPLPTGETAALTIDFGNGARREFDALPWKPKMTVGGLMRAARDVRPGVVYTQRGEGEMTFLTSLEGVANEGDKGRNWFYSVNDERGNVSFEVQPLEAGDHVLWAFKPAD